MHPISERRKVHSAAIAMMLLLSGCTGISRGVAEAVLNNNDTVEVDNRLCEVEGPGFPGLAASLQRQSGYGSVLEANRARPRLKVLMVHGIGTHAAGYSGPMWEHLSIALDLPIRAPRPKKIHLVHKDFPGEVLGEMTIHRFVSEDREKEMIFSELLWSPISDPAKASIAFDRSSQYTEKRAALNDSIKSFINDKSPDPIIFSGVHQEKILASVGTALCWSLTHDWEDLPLETREECNGEFADAMKITARDDYAIITHSLGSRIALDALQRIVDQRENLAVSSEARQVMDILQDKKFSLFMLANQLPLLEVGQNPQEITGQQAAYCQADGEHYEQRLFGQTEIVAFSDPNDILSYPITPEFVDTYMESRICPSVTNVTLNVAHVQSALGIVEFADPSTAHSGYDKDARVVALMVAGDRGEGIAPIVKDRCKIRQIDPALQ